MKMKAPPWRLWIGSMIFMTTFTNYMLRSNLSVSIVSMVKPPNKTKIAACVLAQGIKLGSIPKKKLVPDYGPRYEWSEAEQGLFLAAYFYGYVGTVLLGGPLSEWLGAVNVIAVTGFAGAVFTAITPVCAQYGIGAVVALRVLVGLVGGPVYPAINVILARWAPPQERSKFMVAMLGNTLGTVVTWGVVGVTTEQTKDWAWGFYVVSIIMMAYCIIFFIIVTDSPLKHRWISEREKNYIFDSQGGTISKKKKVAPFLKIIKSRYFWPLAAAQMGSLWCLNLILTYAPKYMAQTQGHGLQNSSFLASIPYICRLICSIGFGFLGDFMKARKVMSLTKIRKFFTIFSHLLPAITFWVIKPINCNWKGTLTLLVLNQAFNGSAVVSCLQNPQDLAPNFAGTVFGLMNFVGSLSGFIVPSITGALLKSPGPLEGPIYIFMIGGIVTAIGGLTFIAFGTAEIQPWNAIPETPEPAPTTT